MKNKGRDGGQKIVESTEVILAAGQVATGKQKTLFAGAVLALLTVGGVCVLIWQNDQAKDVWVIIGPIISSGLTRLLSREDKR